MNLTKILLSVALVATAAVGLAQDTNTPTPPALVGGLEQIVSVFGGQAPTNITAGPFLTADTHGKNIGWGVALAYNLNNNVAFGLVVDSIPQQFSLFTGQVQFKVPIYPLAWTTSDTNSWLKKFEVDPLAFAGVGSAMQSSGGASVSLVTAAGANVPLVKVLGGELSVAAWYEKLTGAGKYDGNRIGICPNWHKSF